MAGLAGVTAPPKVREAVRASRVPELMRALLSCMMGLFVRYVGRMKEKTQVVPTYNYYMVPFECPG